jgi:hypothetical protein
MSLFTATRQAAQLIMDALVVSNNTADNINSAATTKNLILNLFIGVIAKTPLC